MMIHECYKKYTGTVTCAYKEDIYTDRRGVAYVGAKRTVQREKYIFQGLNTKRKPILIECPTDVLALEFEGSRTINEAVIMVIEHRLIKQHLDYCVADHGGTSPYIYLWHLGGLPQGIEQRAKKHIALKIVPEKYHSLLDYSNLGKTLIPIIGMPHWKPKYNGAIHKIVRGKQPELHRNHMGVFLKDFAVPPQKKTSEPDQMCKYIKSSLTLSDVLSYYGMDTSRNPTTCLWHGSKSGRNFKFDNAQGLWKCWHCDKAGNIFHFIMEQEQCDFPTAKKRATEMAGMTVTNPVVWP